MTITSVTHPSSTPSNLTNLTTIGQRIRWAREQRKLTQAALAKRAGVSQGTIGNAESGARAKPRELLSIAEALSASIVWLDSGKGSWDDVSPQSAGLPELQPRVDAPLITWVQAGVWNVQFDPYTSLSYETWLPCPAPHGPRTYCLKVRGDSMSNPSASPSYSDGDVIFVDPDVAIVHGDRVVANYNNGQEVVFRQFMQDGGRKYLKALNPDWRPRFTEIDGSTDICGKVIGKWVAD